MDDRDRDGLAVYELVSVGDREKPLAVNEVDDVGDRVCVGLVVKVAESDGERDSVKDAEKLLEKHALEL